jgi:hypothetical protein
LPGSAGATRSHEEGFGQQGRPKIVVFWTRRGSVCDGCGEQLPPGGLIRLREETAWCLDCSDLDHLVFLPRGDAALTRRAVKHSGLSAMVVRWSRSRRRYERQGILVEETALLRAEEECLSDFDRREARRLRAAEAWTRADRRYVEDFARAIRSRYLGCPEGTDLEIAERACERYSGRVGRTAAAKALADEAIELAVRAHVRHRYTRYDEYLMNVWERNEARAGVRTEEEEVLARWRASERSEHGSRRRHARPVRSRRVAHRPSGVDLASLIDVQPVDVPPNMTGSSSRERAPSSASGSITAYAMSPSIQSARARRSSSASIR